MKTEISFKGEGAKNPLGKETTATQNSNKIRLLICHLAEEQQK